MKRKDLLFVLLWIAVLVTMTIVMSSCASHYSCPTYSVLYYNENEHVYFIHETKQLVSQGDCFIKVPPGDLVVVQEVTRK